MENKIITLVGGSGFLGRYVVRLLAKEGYVVRVVTRRPQAALHLKTAGAPGQIVLLPGNLAKPSSVLPHLEGAFAVVNMAGILFESGAQRFSLLHSQAPEKLAKEAKALGCKAFVHISALGVDRATPSRYARTKVLGEKAVRGAFHDATILRPSVMFGQEDNFYNQFARMASLLPALPLIGGGKTKFQPVYVGDVAQAVLASIRNPVAHGRTYELGGRDIFTFREILEYIMAQTGHHRRLVNLPFGVAGAMGGLANWLPRPPLTADQVRLLKHDNIVGNDAPGLKELGISPTPVSAIVPQYLARYRSPSRQLAA